MNKIDLQLLELLKRNSKLPLKSLEEKLEIRSSTIHSRIKKLEQRGIISSYTLNIDNKQIGYPLVGFIMLTFDQTQTNRDQSEIAGQISALARTEEVHLIAGEFDILVKVRAKNIEDLGEFVTKDLKDIDGIGASRTHVSLKIVKESYDSPYLISKVVEDYVEEDSF
ncbi:MAG: Lrp/AsnC family transcriptional regulator [Candidatus Heimdallarchaeota archaeon]|nr:Lrp/AsnC family transcriptional regulator [Candidatus Heimdallarchaeota archaeon]